ncbi:helix-turn-helix transcriptional regulator [Streptomyces sp. NPDC056682]|uniref:helix-turn-helix transcriptional regulator n=1 Tax=Streptomyces sp. NPDC056682 TaxID=3345909 RepID=UPI00367E2399
MNLNAKPEGNDTNEIFAAWLRAERERVGLSQGALAATVSREGRAVYQQTIAKIEGGERGIELDLAVAITAAFGTTPDVALGLAAEQPDVRALRGVLTRRETCLRSLAALVSAELEHTAPCP